MKMLAIYSMKYIYIYIYSIYEGMNIFVTFRCWCFRMMAFISCSCGEGQNVFLGVVCLLPVVEIRCQWLAGNHFYRRRGFRIAVAAAGKEKKERKRNDRFHNNGRNWNTQTIVAGCESQTKKITTTTANENIRSINYALFGINCLLALCLVWNSPRWPWPQFIIGLASSMVYECSQKHIT